MFKFSPGKPACPVGCRYCFITEHDDRRAVWNTNPIGGINRACSFINVTPGISQDPLELDRFKQFPYELLQGDFIGFTAITDPFWSQLEPYLQYWLERASEVGKLATCVSKWPINKTRMQKLARYPNFFLVVTITGNDAIERVSMRSHLRTLALAKEWGVEALPIAHPYISGVSDLWFLPEIKKLGYDFFDVKGLRYCHQRMAKWMPELSQSIYVGKEDQEILPEDGWRERVADAGLKLLSPRQWYLKRSQELCLGPRLDRKKAENLVKELMGRFNVVSSNSSEVFESAVQRRL